MKLSKIAVACLALCLVGSVVPFANVGEMPAIVANAEEAPTSGTCGENVTWSFDKETGTLTISGTGEMKNIPSVAISENSNGEIDGVRYGFEWHNYFDKILSVVIEDGVKSIGDSAFSCCVNVSSVVIPESVTRIGSGTFSRCSSLTSVTIPKSVSNIGNNAFGNCNILDSISVAENNTHYRSIDGALFTKDMTTLVQVPAGKVGEYIIPESVTNIERRAFNGCKKLVSITIPESVTSIGNSLFSDCTSLTTIDIPKSVTSIGDSAFWGCTSLTSIIIPESVTSIENYAFSCCTALKSITIPDGVTSIKDGTFSRCASLTSVNIPDSVKSIGSYAFYECSKLSTLSIPETVTTIYKGAFDRCDNTTVTILNAECEFLKPNSNNGTSAPKTKVIVYGYENSTAQTYFTTEANDNHTKTEYEFRIIGQEYPEDKISGDLNGDGELSVSDVIAFNQKLGKRQALPKNCDLNGDGIVNVIDLALLKRALLNK